MCDLSKNYKSNEYVNEFEKLFKEVALLEYKYRGSNVK